MVSMSQSNNSSENRYSQPGKPGFYFIFQRVVVSCREFVRKVLNIITSQWDYSKCINIFRDVSETLWIVAIFSWFCPKLLLLICWPGNGSRVLWILHRHPQSRKSEHFGFICAELDCNTINRIYRQNEWNRVRPLKGVIWMDEMMDHILRAQQMTYEMIAALFGEEVILVGEEELLYEALLGKIA